MLSDNTVKLLPFCHLLSKCDLICPILFPNQTKSSSEQPQSAVRMEVCGEATAGRTSEFFWLGLVVSSAPSACSQAGKGDEWSCTISREPLISKCTVTEKGCRERHWQKACIFLWKCCCRCSVAQKLCCLKAEL